MPISEHFSHVLEAKKIEDFLVNPAPTPKHIK